MAFIPVGGASGLPQSGFTPVGGATPAPKPSLDSSQAALGHSQGVLDRSQVFQSGLTNIASGKGAQNLEVAAGGGKQLFSDLSSAGAQNAGPIGADMLSHAPAFAQNLQGLKDFTQPSNTSQAVGAAGTQEAEFMAAGGADLAKGAVDAVKAIPAAYDALKSGELFSKGLSGARGIVQDFAAKRATKATLNLIKATPKTMTTNELKAAASRIGPHTTGGGALQPSETEQRAAQLLHGEVGKNEVKNVPVILDKISQLGKEAEQHLGMNGKPIDSITHDDVFARMREEAAKYLPPSQMKPGGSYDHTVQQFENELSQMTDKNTGTYYKALKNFEDNVTTRLRGGVENLLSDEGSAQLQAAKDIRTTVRNLIGDYNPEFKSKMFDIASLYDAKDTAITKAVQFLKQHGEGKVAGTLKNLASQYPKTATALGAGTSFAGLEFVKDKLGL